MFGAGGVELRVILELEQECKSHPNAEFLVQPPPGRGFHGLRARGWLQQLLDQYSGQSRLVEAGAAGSAVRRGSLKISKEKARCSTPWPSWHSVLLMWPTPRSASSTRIKGSESAIIVPASLPSYLTSSMTTLSPPSRCRSELRGPHPRTRRVAAHPWIIAARKSPTPASMLAPGGAAPARACESAGFPHDDASLGDGCSGRARRCAAAAMIYTLAAMLAVLATRLRRRPQTRTLARGAPPVTILKPLCGNEHELYDCLRSFCDQDYPNFQIVFGVSDAADPAIAIVQRLQREFPAIDLALSVDQRQHGTSRKVSNLINMMRLARHD